LAKCWLFFLQKKVHRVVVENLASEQEKKHTPKPAYIDGIPGRQAQGELDAKLERV
jgi:hypothetical protein